MHSLYIIRIPVVLCYKLKSLSVMSCSSYMECVTCIARVICYSDVCQHMLLAVHVWLKLMCVIGIYSFLSKLSLVFTCFCLLNMQ